MKGANPLAVNKKASKNNTMLFALAYGMPLGCAEEADQAKVLARGSVPSVRLATLVNVGTAGQEVCLTCWRDRQPSGGCVCVCVWGWVGVEGWVDGGVATGGVNNHHSGRLPWRANPGPPVKYSGKYAANTHACDKSPL